MISYIQNKLQKHNKIFFFTILTVVIVAFVFTIDGGGFGGGERAARNDFFGYNLSSERDVREMMNQAELSHRMSQGTRLNDLNQLQNIALERAALLGLADKLRIPGPTEEQLGRFLATREGFHDHEGRFDRQKYSDFIDEIDADPQLSERDLAIVVEQDYRIEKARKLNSGPGYVLPTEVRLQLERTKALWSVDVAAFDLSGFQPDIEVTSEQLEEFFEENSFRYEREPRVSFSYAFFSRDAFLDAVGEIPEEDLRRHFEQYRDRYAAMKAERDARQREEQEEETGETEEPEEKPEITLADVRDDVETEVRRQRARRLAGRAASDFAYALFLEPNARPTTERFDELLEAGNGELRDAPPASRSEFPPQLRFPRNVQERVFRLSEDRDFSDPLELRDDYIVLVYHETLPSYIPPFEDVVDAVERDYVQQERRRLIAEKGEELRESLRERMAEGASFTEAAEAEELTTQSAESFTRMAAPPEIPRQLVGRLDEFDVREVSPMITQQTAGYFVYVRQIEIPEIDRTDEEFVATQEQIRTFSSMISQHALLEEFIERQRATN